MHVLDVGRMVGRLDFTVGVWLLQAFEFKARSRLTKSVLKQARTAVMKLRQYTYLAQNMEKSYGAILA